MDVELIGQGILDAADSAAALVCHVAHLCLDAQGMNVLL